MNPSAAFFLKRLSTECTDPSRAEQKMKSTVKTLLMRNKSILRRNFLQKIFLKGIGTNKVESIAETLAYDTGKTGEAKEAKRRSFLKSILTIKISDAEEDVKYNEHQYHKCKRDLTKTINQDLLIRFQRFNLNLAEKEWEDTKKKLNSKIKHLERKYTSHRKTATNTRGIKVTDEEIGPQKPLPDPAIFNIDKENISKNVKSALLLHPKLAVANPIKMVDVKTEIQKCFYKQRLNMKSEEDRLLAGETEEEAEVRETEEHSLVDEDSNTLNFSKLRVTDIPTNKTVGIPPLATNKVEIQMAATEAELVQVTKEYMEKECNSKGFPKESNLSREAQEGIKELKVMTKDDKIVTKTDKSEKLSLNTLESYKKMGEPHTTNDKTVNPKEVSEMEKQLNGHTYQLCRILGVCTAWDDGSRVKPAMTNKNLPPPCLRLCTKDHKPIQPNQAQLPCRPICGASESPNGQASHLVSMILNEVARIYNEDSECVSTEDMVAAMERLNTRNDTPELFIGSMDVRSLYPSLLAIPTAEIVTKVFTEVDIKIEGVDWSEAGKYLALNLSQKEIQDLNLRHLVSTRKNKGGRHPGMTTAEVLGKLYKEGDEETNTLFNPPQSRPTEQEKKIILSQVLKIAILTILSKHTYQWNQEVKLQSDGAPIGLEIAGSLARVVMLWWDKQFIRKTEENGVTLHLYKRYIDDQNMAGKPLQPGSRWIEGPWADGFGKMMVIEDKKEQDSQIPASVRSMTELKKMANSIHPMIQLDEDHQHNHHDRKLPILDLKVWVSEDGSGNQRLRWQYYRKPMANWLLLPAESAMSMATKRTTLTQYGLRILRNTSLEISWDVKAEMLSEFCERMKDSGYNQKFRAQVIDSILKGPTDKVSRQRWTDGDPRWRPLSTEIWTYH